MIRTQKCASKKGESAYQIDLMYRYRCGENGILSGFTGTPKPEAPVQLSDPPTDDELKAISAQHGVFQPEFENMVGKFFFPDPIPFPESRTVNEMLALIAEAGEKNKIQFEYDDFDRQSNTMEITVPRLASPIYSAYLFRGILLRFPQTARFHFYKAIDGTTLTVAIAAIDGNGAVQYLGELSGLYP